MAGGYKITTLSVNNTALSGANVASSHRADAAYFNPANMSWFDEKNHLETDLNTIYLSSIKYTNASDSSIYSKSEYKILPALFFVSKPVENVRFGLCLVTPAGLTKRWDDQPARFYAKEYTLKTIEVNPSASYKPTENLSLAVGYRAVYSKAKLKGDGNGLPDGDPRSPISRDMSGDSIDSGYNLALSYRPTDTLYLAATYRSKVDLTLKGDAHIVIGSYRTDTKGEVKSLIPASLSLAVSYKITPKTIFEFVYEKTFWSDNEKLDFDFADSYAESLLGKPIPKMWKDAAAYRAGVTHYKDRWRLMAGAFYDETPVPEFTLGFETPDSDSYGFSFGGRYKISRKLETGFATMVLFKKDRSITDNQYSINGTFSNSRALIFSFGLGYDF